MTKTSINVLNSGPKESITEKFTKPLRGFLGGKKVTTVGSKNLLSGMERIGVGIILLTIGLPYTLVAGGILTGSIIKNEAFKKKVKPVKTQESDVPSLKTVKEATAKFSKTKQDSNKKSTPTKKDPSEKNATEKSESTSSSQDNSPPAGHADYVMAMNYKEGSGVKQDMHQAFHYFQLAADQNHYEAKFELARFYKHGVVVWMDSKKAFQLYEEAATNGSDNAKIELGNCYERGIGVKQDKDQAAVLYQDVADRDSEGDYRLGLLYYNPLSSYSGTLTSEDVTKAIAFFEAAADQNHLQALAALIDIYEKGIPGIINYDLDKGMDYRMKLITAQTS